MNLKLFFSEIKRKNNLTMILVLMAILLSNNCKTFAKFSDSILVNAQEIETGFWQPMISQIENTEIMSNSKNIEIDYSLNYYENLDFVQLCYSYNLNEDFICPGDPDFRSTNNKFKFYFDKDGIWSFYTIAYGKNGNIEDLSSLDEKIYKIQIDTQPPTTNLDLTNVNVDMWSGQNLIKNGSFENGSESWDILNGTGDHHIVNNGEGVGETILPITGNEMFVLGFKDFKSENNETDSISQIISLPQNLSSELSFWSRLISQDTADYSKFKVQIRRPDDEILENILITGNLNGDTSFDSGWKNYCRSMDVYAGKTIKLWFEVENKSWVYIDDVKLTTLNIRTTQSFVPELNSQDLGSGILSTSILPEIATGENKLIYNSTDIAANQEQLQASNILVLTNVVINKFDFNNSVELFNNSDNEIDLNNWELCNKNNICKKLTRDNSETQSTIIPPKNKLKFINNFNLENNDGKIILKNDLEQEQDSFSFTILGNWQRSQDGIGTWVLDSGQLDVNIIPRLTADKITMTIFNIPPNYIQNTNDKLNYEIVYTSEGQEKGIAGTINKNTVENNNKTDRDFYLGTCSTGGSCKPESNIGQTLTVTLSGTLNNTEIVPIIKTFNLTN